MNETEKECVVVAVFEQVDAFVRALEALTERGFTKADISILGPHQEILDHFGAIPDVDELADRSDTPRDSLEAHANVRAVVDFLSDSLSVVAELGTAAAAFAVGGPLGVATGASEQTDATVGGFLSRVADKQWHRRLEQSVRDGGIVCWVLARDRDAAKTAEETLAQAGGGHIHRIAPFPVPVPPID